MQTFRIVLAVLALLCGGVFFLCRAATYVWFQLLENYGEEQTLFKIVWAIDILALSGAIFALGVAMLLPVSGRSPKADYPARPPQGSGMPYPRG